MKIYEIGTGYTSIPARISAATEIVVEQLTNAMLELGCDVEILDICDPNRADNNLPINEVKVPSKLVDADVQLGLVHKLKRVIYSIALANKIKNILKCTNEKVVLHFHNQYNMFFFLKLVSKKYRSKCITAYTNHSGIWRMEWPEIEKTIKNRYFQEAICMKYANYVFVLNKETISNACTHLGISENKFVLINNGVNTDIYTPLSDNAIERFKERTGLQRKRLILQVGSIYENKGQLRSIKKLERILKRYPDMVFAYAGGIVSDEYKNEIDTFVKKHGLQNNVKYLGMIEPGKELNELYNAAECTILSSKYEGFSLVVIESMSAGVPVLIEKNAPFSLGKGNIIYTDSNFAQVLEQEVLNKDQLAQHKKEARENVLENYSWGKIAKDYLNCWNMEEKNDH